MAYVGKIFDALFKDKQGNIVILQLPNVPISVWLGCTVLAKFISSPATVHHIFEAVGFGALFTWAWLEISQGTTYFRRILGSVVLVYSVVIRVRP